MLRIIGLLVYPLRPWLGKGVGNVRILKWAFANIVRAIPQRYVEVKANDYKLGMVVGGSRGLDSMAVGLMFGAGYEVGTTRIVKRLVKPGMVVVDVGAHIGYYTVMSSKLAGEKGRVWAYEPEPVNYAELLKNIKLNECKNVTVKRAAVGDKVSPVTLYITKQWSGECGIVRIKNRLQRSLVVDGCLLDETVDGTIDVIKVDVDGSEMAVLRGAREVIKRSPKVRLIMECWKYGMEGAGESCEGYWETLKGLGFTYVYIISNRGMLEQIGVAQLQERLRRVDGVNILCAKEAVEI